jgi:hypothetical protein
MEKGEDWFAIVESGNRAMRMWGDRYDSKDDFFQKVANQVDQFQVNGKTPTVIRVTLINTSDVDD